SELLVGEVGFCGCAFPIAPALLAQERCSRVPRSQHQAVSTALEDAGYGSRSARLLGLQERRRGTHACGHLARALPSYRRTAEFRSCPNRVRPARASVCKGAAIGSGATIRRAHFAEAVESAH